MKVGEMLKRVMTDSGVRPADLRRRLNLESNTMANRLSRDNMSVSKLAETLRAMDYKLIVVPGDTRLRQGEYEL